VRGIPHERRRFGRRAVFFEVTPQGNETVLYAFTGFADRSNPVNGLLADAQGNFYGTALGGSLSVFGEVFQISPKGTFLHRRRRRRRP
jgi:uncharacterized repeat protein (TIGR03803 family)